MSGVVYEPYPAFDTRQVLVTVHYRRRSVTETVPGTTTARQQLDSWRARLSVRRRVVRLYDEHGLPIDLDAPLAKVAGGREWIALALGEPKEGLAAQSSRPPGMGPITHGERLVALSIQASSRAVEADRWIEELLAVAALVVVAVAAGTVGVVELAALLAGHPGPSLTAAALWHGLVGWHHHLGDPKNAFPAALRKVLPGPVVMYFAVAVVGVVVVGLAVAILTFFVRSAGWRVDDRTARRRGLGPDRAVGRQFPKQPGTVYFARTAQSGGALYLGADRSLGAVLGPGTGKSVAALGWIIDTPGPVRATSTKLELWAGTAPVRTVRTGLPARLFDPARTAGTTVAEASLVRWSPIEGCKDPDTAVRRAAALMDGAELSSTGGNGRFFKLAGALVLRLALHACALDQAGITELRAWVQDPDNGELAAILERSDAAAGWRDDLRRQAASHGETASSIGLRGGRPGRVRRRHRPLGLLTTTRGGLPPRRVGGQPERVAVCRGTPNRPIPGLGVGRLSG
jgi:hypothetical protein